MIMKQIYLVTKKGTIDYDNFEEKPIAFVDSKQANDYFKKCVQEEKELEKSESLDWVQEETNVTFVAYVEGRYNENHVEIKYEEVELV